MSCVFTQEKSRQSLSFVYPTGPIQHVLFLLLFSLSLSPFSEPFVWIFFENVGWVSKENDTFSPCQKRGKAYTQFYVCFVFKCPLFSLFTHRKMTRACEKLFFLPPLCTSYPSLCGEINISGDTKKTHPKSKIQRQTWPMQLEIPFENTESSLKKK